MDHELKYFINEKKKTVTCKATNCQYDLYKILDKRVSSEKTDMKIIFSKFVEDYSFLLNDTYTGTAKCMNGDTFDIEKGKKIARAKMREKYAVDKRNILLKFIFKTEKFLDILNNVIDVEEEKMDIAVEIIEKLGGI